MHIKDHGKYSVRHFENANALAAWEQSNVNHCPLRFPLSFSVSFLSFFPFFIFAFLCRGIQSKERN